MPGLRYPSPFAVSLAHQHHAPDSPQSLPEGSAALPWSCVASGPLMDSQGLGLAVEKVVHHDDVVFLIIIRPRGDVAGGDPDPGDASIVKHDAEEGQGPIAWRGWDDTLED